MEETEKSLRLEAIELKLKRDEAEKKSDNAYKLLKENKEIIEIEKEQTEIHEERERLWKIRNSKKQKIEELFCEEGGRASHSEAYGHNIHQEILDAIEETFNKKALVGSTYEQLTELLVSEREATDKELCELKTKLDELDFRTRTLDDKRQTIYNNTTEVYRQEFSKYSRLYNESLLELGLIIIKKGKGNMPTFSKQKYRKKCLENWRKVWDKIKDKL